MAKLSQKDKVRRHLVGYGAIDNFWAMENIKTIRLGAIIHELRREGMEIDGDYIPGTKNFRYTYNAKPKPRVEYVEVDGVMHAKLVSSV